MNVAFFGANAIFRKIRFESTPLGPDRIEVNYKIPQEDPLYGRDNALVTGNWPTAPDADPESSLIGQSYVCSVTSNFPLGAGYARAADAIAAHRIEVDSSGDLTTTMHSSGLASRVG
jgi:hypothetical protein